MSGSRPSRSPMMRTRTLLLCSSTRSLRTNRRSRPISSRTSAGGRDQFSELNEKIVRKSMPRSPAARTARRNASTPRRCPSTRGSPRWAAQRPLPSMMMATCRGAPNPPLGFGAASVSGMSSCLASRLVVSTPASASLIDQEFAATASDRHDLFFFAGERLIDLADHRVGRLLHLARMTLLVVLADLVLFFQLLEQIEPVAPHMPHRHLGGLGIFVRHLDQLLAALLVELGDAQADHLPLGGRRQTEIGGGDRLR